MTPRRSGITALVLLTQLICRLSSAGEIEPIEKSSHPTRNQPWSSFRNGPENQGRTPVALRELAFSHSDRSIREFQIGGIIWGTPVIDESFNLYVGSSNKLFYSLSKNGTPNWRFKISNDADSLIDSSAVLLPESRQVIVPGGDGTLYALNQDTGQLNWTFRATHDSSSSKKRTALGQVPGEVVDSFEGHVQVGPDGTLYAGSDNGKLYALDAKGNLLWKFQTGLMIWSSPAISARSEWMAFGSLDGKLYLLDPKTGTPLTRPWSADGEIKSSPAIHEQNQLLFGTSNGTLYSLKVEQDPKTGAFGLKKNWAYSVGQEIYSSPALHSGHIVFGSINGNLYALNSQGELLWTFHAYSRILSSPLITEDGVVLFGAKNGKLYALDLQTGERIWSYQTTEAQQKTNLDASVSVDSEGIIHVGSYQGTLYSIPYEYCLNHRTDPRCAFGGRSDPPQVGQGLGETLTTLRRVMDPRQPEALAPHATLQLELIAFENGTYLDQAALDASSVQVKINPPIEIQSEVSSDGRFLNIRAQQFFKPDTQYELQIRGKTYLHSPSWLGDRLKFFGLRTFSVEHSFQTEAFKPSVLDDLQETSFLSWGFQSLNLAQPEALDAYIPAALEGQGFLVTAFGFHPETHKLLLLTLPASPQDDGSVELMADASKVNVLQGSYEGGYMKASGRLTFAAMGGKIPFQSFQFALGVDSQGKGSNGEMRFSASALGIRGSGSQYQFPSSLLNRVCDPWLNIVGLGSFSSKPIELAQKASVQLITPLNSPILRLSMRFFTRSETLLPHLITLVQYDPITTRLIHTQTQVIYPHQITAGSQWFTEFEQKIETSCWHSAPFQTQLFLDGRPLLLNPHE
ncbi:MAG: PQQ-binding-like beta-propeller repeat protein [Bdellovibrionia bacterium]